MRLGRVALKTQDPRLGGKLPHLLVVRLLRNRADFYQEILKRLPWEKLRRQIEQAAMNLPELHPPASHVVAAEEHASSTPLSALQLDEWLKKDETGVMRARRIISVEGALEEACHLEELGIMLCGALSEENPGDAENLRGVKSAFTRAFSALCDLRDELEYHRLTLLDSHKKMNNNHLA
jgi:hypothetical protein